MGQGQNDKDWCASPEDVHTDAHAGAHDFILISCHAGSAGQGGLPAETKASGSLLFLIQRARMNIFER